MFTFTPVEIVGYVASALVVVSLSMTSVVRLRTISLVGSATFVVYGALIGSLPIILTNGAIAVLNVWFLRAELGQKRDLGAVPIAADAPFLTDFLASHLPDIRVSQPDFIAAEPDSFALMLTRDGLPAGALIGKRRGSELALSLDYVMAAYRDSRIGNWLYSAGARAFTGAGITTVVARPVTDIHRGYLEAVGFTAAGDHMVRTLD